MIEVWRYLAFARGPTVDAAIASVTIGQMADGYLIHRPYSKAGHGGGRICPHCPGWHGRVQAIGLDTGSNIYPRWTMRATGLNPSKTVTSKWRLCTWYPKTVAATTRSISASVTNATTIDGGLRRASPDESFMSELSLSIVALGRSAAGGQLFAHFRQGTSHIRHGAKKPRRLRAGSTGRKRHRQEREINNPFTGDARAWLWANWL